MPVLLARQEPPPSSLRYTPAAEMAMSRRSGSNGWTSTVWRTTDAGASWEPLTAGLPQQDAHLTVLRDAFTCDGADPAGLWFGTRTGEVYASVDDGDTWQLWADHLPPVLTVRAASIG